MVKYAHDFIPAIPWTNFSTKALVVKSDTVFVHEMYRNSCFDPSPR